MFVGKHTQATKAKMRARALERWADPVFYNSTTAALGAAQKRNDARENHRQGSLRFWRAEAWGGYAQR